MKSSFQAWFLLGGLLLGMILITLVAGFQRRIVDMTAADQRARGCLIEAKTVAARTPFKITDQDALELCRPELKAARVALERAR